MPTREEKIAFLQSQDAQKAGGPTREQKIAFLMSRDKNPPPEEGGGVLQTIGKVGSAIDSVTGAPTRAAISAAQDDNSSPIFDAATETLGPGAGAAARLLKQAPAFGKQFAQDPSKAPEGRDIAVKAGVSDKALGSFTGDQALDLAREAAGPLTGAALDAFRKYVPKEVRERVFKPSAADIAGAGITMVADPTNLLPVLGEGKAMAEAGGSALKTAAEKAAVNATGATGLQAAKFGKNAGRELLDRGIVTVGADQAKIAEKASAAVEEAEKGIDQSLSALDKKGVTVDANDIVKKLETRIEELRKKPSNAKIVRGLQEEIENTKAAVEARGGDSNFPISEAEQEKRGYDKAAKNWADPHAGQVGKEVYQTWRKAVEEVATAADPALADQFSKAKKAYGLLAPIEEAAQRRVRTMSQSQPFNLKDIAAAGVGGVKGVIANRVISPRLASTAAVAMDKTGGALKAGSKAIDGVTKVLPVAAGPGAELAADAPKVLKVADNETPSKGPTKWAQDGLQNLKQHAGSDDLFKTSSDALMKNPAIRDLLIKASDLKPGSKAMDDLLSKVKAKLASGDD